MNAPSTASKRKTWMRAIIGLLALTGVLVLCVCMVLSAMGGALLLAPRVIDAVWLRPLADQLGTETSKAALVAHVNELLGDHKGSSREDVHRLLNDIGGFSYLRPLTMRNGESEEDAWWTLAELPLGLEIAESWTLRYDIEDRLIEVLLSES